MNTKRYVIAGTASIIIHSVVLSAVPNTMVMAMPVGTESTRVSLNLVSAPKPTPQPVAETQVVQETIPVAKPKSIEKQTAVKKLVKKKKPEVTQDKPIEKTITKTKKEPPKKPEEKTAKTVTKPQPEKKVAKKETKPANAKPVVENQPEVKAQAASGVNSSPKLVTQPTFSTSPSPVKYPRLAKRRGIEGQVMVEVWLDPNGKQIKHTLVKSSGAQVLDKAALEAIKRWHFSSHIIDGQAIAHRVQIPVRFELD
ncbi:energy transducer TonB [Photobacterium sp. SDRW27]|uniref:energy transducer TonB n=1 Tax=Photobacterium obscurum TaxID=2829490 RepID=UPI002244C5A1|nr:energy transducer TonB [Photobacterium obscurum]MCW8327752.1 energy transducer TonB [Photobacterium obscurum]